jgi:hypothetical protein
MKTVAMTGEAACQVVQSGEVDWSLIASDIGVCDVPVFNAATAAPAGACAAACGDRAYRCTLPKDYLRAYVAAQPPSTLQAVCADGGDAVDTGTGAASDASVTAAGVCPPVSGTLNVTCTPVVCAGRWTPGVETPGAQKTSSLGARRSTGAPPRGSRPG